MPSPTPSRLRKPLLVAFSLVLLVAVVFGLRDLLHEDVVVSTANAEHRDLVTTTGTNGKVEPVDNFQAHSPYPGVIQHIYVHQGDTVAKNKLLLAMDDSDARVRVAAALAALRSAELALRNIEQNGSQEERFSLSSQIASATLRKSQDARDLTMLQSLQASGAATSIEVANAQEKLKQDDNSLQLLQQRKTGRFSSDDVAHATAQVADAQASYAFAQSVLAQAIVRAPFAGTVYSLPVRDSDYVNAGETLLQMANLSQIRVRAFFDEPELGKLAVGQFAKIEWDAKPGMSWHGHVERVPSTVISYGTRNVGEVLVSVDSSDGTLLPNTNVNVRVTILNKPNVLTVPREALTTAPNSEDYVFRILDGKAVRTPVKIGDLNLTSVEILDGLKQGDTVALGTLGGQTLTDGESVRVAQRP